jgi:hypothetical protein
MHIIQIRPQIPTNFHNCPDKNHPLIPLAILQFLENSDCSVQHKPMSHLICKPTTYMLNHKHT